MHRPQSPVSISVAASAFVVLLSAAACPPREEDQCARPDQHTIVFFDQSASSVADQATTAMFRDSVTALLESSLECQGDAVHGFLVHGNTRGKVNRLDVVNTVATPDTIDVPSIQKTREASRYRRDIGRIRTSGEAGLAALLTANVNPQYERHTDMLGTLEVVSDEMTKAPAGSKVVIYYLGDMHESMQSPRRDFDARPPASKAEAEAWADADTALLSGMKIDRARLENAEVRVLLGNLADRPGAQEVRSYWERLFANVGMKVRYN